MENEDMEVQESPEETEDEPYDKVVTDLEELVVPKKGEQIGNWFFLTLFCQ